MVLNEEEKILLDTLDEVLLTKEQADASLQLDSAYKTMLLTEVKEDLGLRLETYENQRFVKLDDKYIRFEDFLLYLITIGYIENPLENITDDFDIQLNKKIAVA